MGVGDEVLAAGQAQRHFDLTGEPSVIVDHRGQPRWHEIWTNNPAIVPPAAATPQHHLIVNGPNCRPYIVYPFTAESGWTFNRSFRCADHVAKIYLTAPEQALGEQLRQALGSYVLIEPWSKHANLRWPIEHWTALVAARPTINFVQHVHVQSRAAFIIPGVRLTIDATFREACGLVAAATTYIRGESGMLHAAAALGARTIALWGGCMDWTVMGGYAGQIGVGISHPPCGSYKPCAHCMQTMREISVDRVLKVLDAVVAESG